MTCNESYDLATGEITMSAGLLVWAVVLAFLGLNLGLVAWLSLRFTLGPIWALIAFNSTLACTIWAVFGLIA